MILWLDLETYSSTPIANGIHKYSEDASIILFAYAIDNKPAKVWDVTTGEPIPEELDKALHDDSVIIYAHNSHFDRTITKKFYPCVSDPKRWRDTMILAYSYSLPGSLHDLCGLLQLPTDKAKDEDGRRLVLLFTKPRPATSTIRRATRETHPEDWARFVNYARLDVEAMREVYNRLPKWNDTPEMWAEWHLDQEINDRGMNIDTELVKAAVEAVKDAKDDADENIRALTNGDVQTVGQCDALLKHIANAHKIALPDTQKATLERRLNDPDVPQAVKEIIELRLNAGMASVKKFEALQRSTNTDGRLRGCLQFYGAGRTGRWCLTGDHEVLTPSGWIRLDQWQGGEILCYNPITNGLTFKKSKALCFDYEGDLYHINTKRCDQLSTPDHKMPVLNDKTGYWDKIEVKDLCNKRFSIAFTGRISTATLAKSDINALRVLIMTQADGYYSENTIRYHFKKLRKVERCKRLLRQCDIPFLYNEYKDGSITIAVKNYHAPIWLLMFSDKTFGPWILNMPADVVFDELEQWDAYRSATNSVQYSSCNKTNIDLLQALAHMNGYSATVINRGARKENWNDNYNLNIWYKPGRSSIVRSQDVTKENTGRETIKVYCAETETGFFTVRRNGKVWITGNSGKVFQPQNITRGSLKPAEVEEAIQALKNGSAPFIYDNINRVISSCIRGAICAPKGKKLVVADLSNIEGRVLAWLAGENWKLQAFRDFDAGHGTDLYKATYGRTFGIDPKDVTKQQRQIGKVLELAMGYSGGVGAFLNFANVMRVDLKELAQHTFKAIDSELLAQSQDAYTWFKAKGMTEGIDQDVFIACEAIKRAWRSAHPATVKLWADLDNAFLSVLRGERDCVKVAHSTVFRKASYLCIKLPSGRSMCYPVARLPQPSEKASFCYWGQFQASKNWGFVRTYSGKCTENLTQAVARDVLASTMQAIDDAGYKIVLSVHDELITETPDTDNYNNIELSKFMATAPEWAEGLPLAAAGFDSYRYKKD